MIKFPETESDLQHLVNNNISEDVHLDYKASDGLSDKKKDEILKDVSAFANSDGGILIYGIKEDKNTQTISIDNGVEPTKSWEEWLEQIIDSGISPKINGLEINAIKLNNSKFAYAVKILKSPNAPHQSSDKKYYKRFNTKSSPMEHYEIEDTRNRSHIIQPLVNIDIEIKENVVYLVISNQGDYIAENVNFVIPEPMKEYWIKNRSKELPSIFDKGLKLFYPKKSYKFFYSTYPTLVNDEDLSNISIEVCYFHPQISAQKTENFCFNLKDFLYTSLEGTDLFKLKTVLREKLEKITDNLKKIAENTDLIAENMSKIAKLKSSYFGYFVEKQSNATLYEYDCRVIDIVNSSHNFFEQNLSRFIYFINNDKNINEILSTLPFVDFNAWYETARSSRYSMAGSGTLEFPINELEKLALLKILFEKMQKDKNEEVSFYGISHDFMYVSGSLNDCVAEVVRLLFIPFARSIRNLITSKNSIV